MCVGRVVAPAPWLVPASYPAQAQQAGLERRRRAPRLAKRVDPSLHLHIAPTSCFTSLPLPADVARRFTTPTPFLLLVPARRLSAQASRAAKQRGGQPWPTLPSLIAGWLGGDGRAPPPRVAAGARPPTQRRIFMARFPSHVGQPQAAIRVSMMPSNELQSVRSTMERF